MQLSITEVLAQNRLRFPVSLYLDGDELHITAGEKFWIEWFPADRQEVVVKYREAALGILSGRYRIVEYLRGHRAVKAILQRPKGEDWETIGVSGGLGAWIFWRSGKSRVLQAARE